MKIGTPQGATKFKMEGVAVQVKIYGEGLEGKMKGKTVYQTYDSIIVTETTPEEVFSIVRRSIEAAATRK